MPVTKPVTGRKKSRRKLRRDFCFHLRMAYPASMMAFSRPATSAVHRTVTCFFSRSAAADNVPGTPLQAFSTAAVQ